jgi:hypothetical protein
MSLPFTVKTRPCSSEGYAVSEDASGVCRIELDRCFIPMGAICRAGLVDADSGTRVHSVGVICSGLTRLVDGGRGVIFC